MAADQGRPPRCGGPPCVSPADALGVVDGSSARWRGQRSRALSGAVTSPASTVAKLTTDHGPPAAWAHLEGTSTSVACPRKAGADPLHRRRVRTEQDLEDPRRR